jgi:hypothetical protein
MCRDEREEILTGRAFVALSPRSEILSRQVRTTCSSTDSCQKIFPIISRLFSSLSQNNQQPIHRDADVIVFTSVLEKESGEMGPWGIAAILAIAAFSTEGGRTYARKIFKSGIKAGIEAREKALELADKAKDYKDDLVAEIEAEAVGDGAGKPASNGRSKSSAK